MKTKFEPLSPRSALAVVAHPDDIEVCFGGTLATWSKEGADIHYLILTDGSNGTSDTTLSPAELAKTRQQEQQTAAAIIGAKTITFGSYKDGELTNSLDVRRDIVRAIRKTKPDVVLTFDPTHSFSLQRSIINHPDHRAAGQAALDAVFPLARDHLAFPELADENLAPHKTGSVLLVNYDTQNHYIDITDAFEAKLQALAAHKSQFTDIDQLHDRMREWGQQMGRHIDARYAEAFIRLDIQ